MSSEKHTLNGAEMRKMSSLIGVDRHDNDDIKNNLDSVCDLIW